MIKKFSNKFTHSNTTYSNIMLIVFTLTFIFSSYLYFQYYKQIILNKKIDMYKVNVNYLNSKLNNDFLTYNKENIKKDIEKVFSTSLFSLIKIDKNRYIFDKNTLIDNSEGFNDKSWSLGEVIVDVRFGLITKLPNSSYYEFISSNNYEITQPLRVRYQLFKNGQIKNIIAKLDFSNIKEKRLITGNNESSFLRNFLDTNKLNKTYPIKKQGYTVASITYEINKYEINSEIQNFLFTLILFNIVMCLPLIFVLGFYHKYLFKKYVTLPVNYLNEYLENILLDKFSIIDKSQFEGTPEIKELTKKISKLSGKVAALKNELNVNKESLELKVSSDTLTGLPNKTIFDFDIKSMYVSAIPGYIFILKIEKLSEISEKYDSGYINSFIESYVNILKNVIFKYNKEMKLYRFYGSKFAIIAKNIEMETCELMCNDIIKELNEKLSDIYNIPDDYIQIGGTFFDIYGTIDSLLSTLEKAYERSKIQGKNSFYIVAEDEIERNYSELDSNVVDIIKRAEFNLKFVFDTYTFDDDENLIMSEASPQLIDSNGNPQPIGSFISVADKLHIADKFDKLVLVKTLAYIRGNNIDHKIAINISMTSIKNKEFMKWLLDVLKANQDIIDKIAFSITSYTAYLNKDSFIEFIKSIHKVGASIILKRYKTTDYPLEELKNLNLDYIRMSHEYTTGFSNDVIKKHKVKNILIFAELYNIKVVADTVKLDADYDLLERLGTYAASR